MTNIDAFSYLSYAVLVLGILAAVLGTALVRTHARIVTARQFILPAFVVVVLGAVAVVGGGPFILDAALRTLKIGFVSLRSPDSPTKATVDFVNKSDAVIKLYWIDQKGVLNPYTGLGLNDHYEQQTYVGHRWLITDAKDRPIAVYTVGAPKSLRSLLSSSMPRIKVEITNSSVCETDMSC